MKWAHHPNLRKRPRTPAKGRGSVQRAIKRAFAASGTEALTSSAIYDWAHIRRRLGRRKSMPFGVYSRTLRTLRAMCDRLSACRRMARGCGACERAGRESRLAVDTEERLIIRQLCSNAGKISWKTAGAAGWHQTL
jgi:hypothetical protein